MFRQSLVFFFTKEYCFWFPFTGYQTTFTLSYIYIFAVFERDGINRVGPFLPQYLVKREDMCRLNPLLCIGPAQKSPVPRIQPSDQIVHYSSSLNRLSYRRWCIRLLGFRFEDTSTNEWMLKQQWERPDKFRPKRGFEAWPLQWRCSAPPVELL